MNKRNFFSIALASLMAIMTVALVSCNKDDDNSTQAYSLGISKISQINVVTSSSTVTDPTDLTSLSLGLDPIYNAYKTALGISASGSSDFTLTGTESDCDAKVLNACAQAEAALKGQVTTASFTFEIKRLTVNNKVVVYSKEFTAGATIQ